MIIYNQRYNAKAPDGIEDRKAYIVGGGIAGLASALFLAEDCHMPAQNITIYEKMDVAGGSMDAVADRGGYLCRGERELEPYMECFWYLWSKVPSLRHPGRTVLDEVVDFNRDNPISSHFRWVKGKGERVPFDEMEMDQELMTLFLKAFFIPEEELQGVTIEDYFPERFFHTALWHGFHNMLAFKRYHSLIEAKRYWRRFTHLKECTPYLIGILHTDLNEYDAMIKPLIAHLEKIGVNIVTGADVKEILMDDANNTAIGLDLILNGQNTEQEVRPQDMVLFTNGSMSQNSAFGDNDTVAPTNRDTTDLGVFSIWEKLAARDEKFGHPEKFIGHIDQTKWMSFFPTIRDYPQFIERMEKKTGSKAGNGGIISFVDSSWDMSIILHHKPFFEAQKENEEVFWGYGLYGENPGDYIKKPMCECTGDEILQEMLYHLGMLDMYEEMRKHTYVSTCMMPYITSQFMPRNINDRPKVIPDGCTNLAFMGQFVETSEDAVFTVETSVRTAMQAAYRLAGIEKDPIEVYPTFYDLRCIMDTVRACSSTERLTVKDLPKVNPLKLPQLAQQLCDFVNGVESLPTLYQGRDKQNRYKREID